MATGIHKQDARLHTRRVVSLDVLVAVPNQPLMTLQTRNLTKEGIYLLAGNKQLPEIGTEVVLTMEEFLLNPVPAAMRARVVYKNDDGMGVEMLGPVT